MLGSLYFSRDYRAEDYGRFSTPQAIRGAVYEAAGSLISDFATQGRQGEFGGDVEAFQHPFALRDAIDYWNELSIELKMLAAILSLLFLFW